MDPENIMLNEISQTQKEKYCMLHLYEVPRIGKFISTERKAEIQLAYAHEGTILCKPNLPALLESICQK